MRIVYLGTPADAVLPLRALHAAGHDVALVVTQPDRRRGRGGQLDASPVKTAALELGLEVRTPERARELTEEVASLGAELGVVVAFGQLLRPALLDAILGGFVNVHYSLLPRWRGAAPVERAILAGDAETGVSLMRLEEGLDTGPVYVTEPTAIDDEESAGELRVRLGEIATRLLLEWLPKIPTTEPVPQRGPPTYAEKLTVDEFRLDWARPAAELARVVRAGAPRPGAWTTDGDARLKIGRARVVADAPEGPPGATHGSVVASGEGALELLLVQTEGKPWMAGEAWARGRRRIGPLGT
ncbi:MAG: methionyl-tRNA formyltransferase [Actinobacteria bacterium]|nr:MAG: methionyl-tRNA formyltransferase [Actinomycetota bacterium]